MYFFEGFSEWNSILKSIAQLIRHRTPPPPPPSTFVWHLYVQFIDIFIVLQICCICDAFAVFNRAISKLIGSVSHPHVCSADVATSVSAIFGFEPADRQYPFVRTCIYIRACRMHSDSFRNMFWTKFWHGLGRFVWVWFSVGCSDFHLDFGPVSSGIVLDTRAVLSKAWMIDQELHYGLVFVIFRRIWGPECWCISVLFSNYCILCFVFNWVCCCPVSVWMVALCSWFVGRMLVFESWTEFVEIGFGFMHTCFRNFPFHSYHLCRLPRGNHGWRFTERIQVVVETVWKIPFGYNNILLRPAANRPDWYPIWLMAERPFNRW